ncbi:unnamed protein product [Blepharisma stoltei]|uniref:Arrestin-like N-terminal domain-containing protein n=1 Tax=Blepharisma stoltei TaxID=1481888 RepID=A0AAU9IF87_9CILI|nr:unnamed protein product [Blepharisma stoltei]
MVFKKIFNNLIMGNHQEGKIKGDIYIFLESTKVNTGGTLSGTIHISLKEQISDPQLLIIFKGSEFVNFRTQHTTSTGKSTITYQITHTGKQLVCELKAMLLAWSNSTVLPGNYSFPFQLKIYDSILPTFYSFVSISGYAKIEYKIKAQLHAKDLKPIKYKQIVSVFTSNITLPPELYPSQITNESLGHGSILCCFHKEASTAKIWLDRATFGNTDSIDVNLETNLSNFSARIKRVEIEIKKIISVDANKSMKTTQNQSHRMWRKNFYPEILPWSGTLIQKFTLPVAEMLANENSYTMNSNLIKCQYVVRVKLHTNYRCFKCYGFKEANQGVVILPFQVEVERVPPPIPPEEWKSNVLPYSSISYESQDTMSSNTTLVRSFVSESLIRDLQGSDPLAEIDK